ncbi:ABC transporter permease [Corynebacterium auris]|uniref:ABC transporter permease n=1 Tax=Corynebacterium auris TaxID=44750 RepID=UPI0025B2ACF2|nr:ABC transporter permease [Corynebacterium auris]WJY69073.1 FtsX-like permease family protein [Corynebacterium auris]
MFVGIREITSAKGRFSLIVGVVGLITLLVVMLTGLTAGLGKQNTSALEALNPASVTFADMEEPSYTTSRVEKRPGAIALGTGETLMQHADGSEESVAILGLPEGTTLPDGQTLGAEAIASNGLDPAEGETVQLGGASISVGSLSEDLYYSHSPVLWVPTATWQEAMHTDADGTVLLNSDDDGMTLPQSFTALPAYGSEQGSLLMIQGFLYAIAALVTVAFLTVWTIQRTRDLAILKAIGASNSYLRKDALGQAGLILAAGVVAGTAIAYGLGQAAANVVPFELSVLSIVGPPLALWALGMVGAWLATRSITKIEPQLALGGIA